MASSYDVSTVVSRSYISEQLQDNMQRGSENRSAFFINEFQKEAERKTKTVQKADDAENPIISENAIKMERERRKRERQNKKQNPEEQQNAEMAAGKEKKLTNRIDFIA